MFIDYFEDEEREEMDSGIFYESACCCYVREKDIFEAIAESKRSEIWD